MIQFFNTLSGRAEPFVPITPGQVKLYTCGPTVYDRPHIGNYRAYVFEDLLKRFLGFMDYRVTHVMNITDVDDKTIRNARAANSSLNDYTKPFIEDFHRGVGTLNIKPANFYPRATDHIPGMVEMIRGLVEKGFAYKKDGSYYFSIAKFPPYGRLSKINLEDLKTGVRVEADEYEKESAHDFALWKKAKEGEPSWETELGAGRPGWHIECSVMSSKYLGRTFDIHCGGVDNIFPHHENEIAQSEAYWGEKFVNTWLHCHHLVVNGEKMSKSKGNFFTLEHILDKGFDPMAVRLLLLSTHYRKSLNFTFEALDQANAALKRIRDFFYELAVGKFPEHGDRGIESWIDKSRKKFVAGLSDDLNISTALAAVFDLIKKVNAAILRNAVSAEDAKKVSEFVRSLDSVLAIQADALSISICVQQSIHVDADKVAVKISVDGQVEISFEEIREKIDLREKARAGKDFQEADRIRQELLNRGILIEDTKDGPRWKIVGKGTPGRT